MARPRFTSVDDYLAAQPDAVRAVLERVRAVIRRALPDAEETVGYQVLAYRLHGTNVIYLAGFKRHYSLYPTSERLLAALGDELTPYLAGKGTIRFSLSAPVPARLIGRIARLRAQDIAERARQRAAARGN